MRESEKFYTNDMRFKNRRKTAQQARESAE